MNRLAIAFVIASTLLSVSGCSWQQARSDEAAEHSHGSHAHGDHSGDGHAHDSHAHHGAGPTTTQAKLTTPPDINPNEAVDLVFDIQDLDGQPVPEFEIFQEQLMHLIVVSDDLRFYDHIHPEYKGDGRFEIQKSFPQSGGYTLISDYKPAGQSEQVSLTKATILGPKPSAPAPEFSRVKTFDRTQVELILDQSVVKAKEDVTISFKLQDIASGEPVADLEPYLGELGHMVIVKQSDSLTKADYIHAHALRGTPADQVDFATQFPEPGKYKAWGQFQRDGKIITADFWIDVVDE
ncbi:MAG: hypothetical protein F6K19_34125 [Cyanothece sp. SIO1E1]|nr:hypothetical protein [Cyanothece sp. SIO1E1]